MSTQTSPYVNKLSFYFLASFPFCKRRKITWECGNVGDPPGVSSRSSARADPSKYT
jgi:hypothetical protein